MVSAPKGAVHHLIVPLQCRVGIAIEGCADVACNEAKVHILRMEDAVTIGEMMHEEVLTAG